MGNKSMRDRTGCGSVAKRSSSNPYTSVMAHWSEGSPQRCKNLFMTSGFDSIGSHLWVDVFSAILSVQLFTSISDLKVLTIFMGYKTILDYFVLLLNYNSYAQLGTLELVGYQDTTKLQPGIKVKLLLKKIFRVII